MATTQVSIDSHGTFSPSTLDVETGDTVLFKAEADTVLCVAPSGVFGAERFEIPAGEEEALLAQRDASALDMVARVGDLSAPCRGGGRERTNQGGSVGGGLD